MARETPPDVPMMASAATAASGAASAPQALGEARWDWGAVRRVLIVRLRSIGDTVLATPSLFALRRFLPEARIDVLLEDWVAPLLAGSAEVDRIITLERKSNASRIAVARQLRAERYDVAFNLHGGSTATILTWASRARRRVGYARYRYARLHTHTAPPSTHVWRRAETHSVEQQLALLGWTGVPVSDRPATRLPVTREASASIARQLGDARLDDAQPFALMHPAAAFESKTWAAENFARVAEHLAARRLATVVVAGPNEAEIVEEVRRCARTRLISLTDLSLPEVTALAARAELFVGNDSGIAHIASAVSTPSVVVFGSSNIAHWRPWSVAPSEVVREEMPCAPCAGYTCAEFERPECIRRVGAEHVVASIERVLGREGQPLSSPTASASV